MKSSQTLKKERGHQIIESWQLPPEEGEKLYSFDKVIEAYSKGVSDGLEQNNKLLFKQFHSNMDKAGKDTEKVFEFMVEKKYTPKSAHLKIESIYDFEILITVSDEDFLKDSFTEVYTFTQHLEQVVKGELYNVSFHFINRSKEFNSQALYSDGFIFTLEKTHTPPAS